MLYSRQGKLPKAIISAPAAGIELTVKIQPTYLQGDFFERTAT